MEQCLKCGNQLVEHAKFCTRCGAPIPRYVVPERASQEAESRRMRQCSKCGNQLAEDAEFCTRCGSTIPRYEAPEMASQETVDEARRTSSAAIPQNEASERANQGTGIGERRAGETSGRSRDLIGDTYGFLTDPSSRRYLKVDTAGGVLTVVAPILIWSAAVGVVSWILIGLVSLRFHLGFIDLGDLLLSQLIIVGIVLSVTANAYVIRRYRGRGEALWNVLSSLPVLWAAFLSIGLTIMLYQVWTDFQGGTYDLRRLMFSLIGVGICGTYTGYLSLVVFGPVGTYKVVRWAVYVLTAVIAVEILDALWLAGENLTQAEIWEHFVLAGWAVLVCCVVYAVIAIILSQIMAGNRLFGVLVTYLVLGLAGFTIGLLALWDGFPEAGPVRFVYGGVMVVSITTIGLLLVQHFHKARAIDTRPPDEQDTQARSRPS